MKFGTVTYLAEGQVKVISTKFEDNKILCRMSNRVGKRSLLTTRGSRVQITNTVEFSLQAPI